jgi:hypothetical protein
MSNHIQHLQEELAIWVAAFAEIQALVKMAEEEEKKKAKEQE